MRFLSRLMLGIVFSGGAVLASLSPAQIDEMRFCTHGIAILLNDSETVSVAADDLVVAHELGRLLEEAVMPIFCTASLFDAFLHKLQQTGRYQWSPEKWRVWGTDAAGKHRFYLFIPAATPGLNESNELRVGLRFDQFTEVPRAELLNKKNLHPVLTQSFVMQKLEREIARTTDWIVGNRLKEVLTSVATLKRTSLSVEAAPFLYGDRTIFVTHSAYKGSGVIVPKWFLYISDHGHQFLSIDRHIELLQKAGSYREEVDRLEDLKKAGYTVSVGGIVAGLDIESLRQFLDFLDMRINTRLVILNSCFSGGVNFLMAVAVNPIALVPQKELSFTVITSGAVGSEVLADVENKQRFGDLFAMLRDYRQLPDWEKAAEYVFEPYWRSGLIENVPLLKEKGRPWAEALRQTHQAIFIGKVLAESRSADAPLDVLNYFKRPALQPGEKVATTTEMVPGKWLGKGPTRKYAVGKGYTAKIPKTVLLAASKVPFELFFGPEFKHMPHFLSLAPEVSLIELAGVQAPHLAVSEIARSLLPIKSRLEENKVFIIGTVRAKDGIFKNLVAANVRNDADEFGKSFFYEKNGQTYQLNPENNVEIPVAAAEVQDLIKAVKKQDKEFKLPRESGIRLRGKSKEMLLPENVLKNLARALNQMVRHS